MHNNLTSEDPAEIFWGDAERYYLACAGEPFGGTQSPPHLHNPPPHLPPP